MGAPAGSPISVPLILGWACLREAPARSRAGGHHQRMPGTRRPRRIENLGVATTVATWTPKQNIQIVVSSPFPSQVGQKFMLAFIISCTAQGNVKRDTSFIGKASSKNTNYSLRPNLLVVFSFSRFITFAMYLYLFIMPRCIMKFLNIKKIKMTNNLGCTARSSR